MEPGGQIPTASHDVAARFATRLGLFYGAIFGLVGTYLPFFTVWLKAVGIDASWIGIITAAPSVTRFTILPVIAGLAERRRALRGALGFTACLTAFGFAVVGTQHWPIAVFLAFGFTACVWTPMVPLTDAYALRGVTQYGLNYGPLRVWGSAAFVVGALACGLLVDLIAARHLIWVIAAVAAMGAIASFGLQPLEVSAPMQSVSSRATSLLRDQRFLAIIIAAALIQGSHAAYYTFASINWQSQGLGGTTIAGLWVLGVVAEIAVFALSPRFTPSPAMLVILGGVSAMVRWLLYAQEPPLTAVAVFQLMHGLTYGLTQVGTMGLLVRLTPGHLMTSAQGYLTAATGLVMSSASILSGVFYAQYGQGVYYGMTLLALLGVGVVWWLKTALDNQAMSEVQPQSAGSGG